MYRINPLMRNVLIMVDEVLMHAPTTHTIDPRMIEPHIIVAEERFIRPALGYEYYYALCEEKNKTITSSNKSTEQSNINASIGSGGLKASLSVGEVVNAYEYMSADSKKLWTQHLWKLCAECVMLLALPEGFVQFGSVGAHHNQPPAGPIPNSTELVTPDLRSMKWAMDKKLQDRIDPLRESMHQWLCVQRKTDKSKYPLYTKACDCDVDGIAYKRKTDIILGIYDDEDDDSGCC